MQSITDELQLLSYNTNELCYCWTSKQTRMSYPKAFTHIYCLNECMWMLHMYAWMHVFHNDAKLSSFESTDSRSRLDQIEPSILTALYQSCASYAHVGLPAWYHPWRCLSRRRRLRTLGTVPRKPACVPFSPIHDPFAATACHFLQHLPTTVPYLPTSVTTYLGWNLAVPIFRTLQPSPTSSGPHFPNLAALEYSIETD